MRKTTEWWSLTIIGRVIVPRQCHLLSCHRTGAKQEQPNHNSDAHFSTPTSTTSNRASLPNSPAPSLASQFTPAGRQAIKANATPACSQPELLGNTRTKKLSTELPTQKKTKDSTQFPRNLYTDFSHIPAS
jgi:hypothetical protein